MPLEGIFIEPTSSTSAPDLSLQISPPSTSSSLICNKGTTTLGSGTNYEVPHNNSATNFFPYSHQAHTELSLGRNFTGPAPEETPPHNNPYYQSQTTQFHHLHHQQNHSNNSTSNRATTSATSRTTPLNQINYGVSLLDVSSDGLRPIKGIPVYHNRSFPFMPMDHSRDKDTHHHHKMCLYHHMPSYPSLSSSCSSLCSTPSSSPSSSPYFAAPSPSLDPMPLLSSGGRAGSAATRFNGICGGDAFKSHLPLHSSQYGVIGPSSYEASSHGLMRSRFLPKLPPKRSMRAPRMRWTSTLHARFVHAVELLGGHESN